MKTLNEIKWSSQYETGSGSSLLKQISSKVNNFPAAFQTFCNVI